jgi:hypothetical protein
MDGYIKLYRQLLEHDLWKDKPFSRGQAWLDMLATANFKDRTVMFDGSLVPVAAGSFITSKRKLSERWGWSNSKISKFFDVLEKEKMITQKSDTKKTVVSIENWDFYQGSGDAETPPKRHENAAETPQKHTDKKDKKDKKEEESNTIPLTPLETEIENFKEFRKRIKKPMTPRAVDLLLINLTKLAGSDEQKKIAILQQSIFNGWQGVFELKDGFQPAKAEQPTPSKPRTGHFETRPGAYGVPEEIWVEDAE